MQRTGLLLTLGFLLFIASRQLFATEMITQETKGPNSPAQYIAPKATGIINYNTYINTKIDQIGAEVRAGFWKCLEATIAFQSQKLEDLNKTLAGLLSQKEGVPEEDAKRWASDIIEKAPKFRNEIESNNALIRRYNEELSKDLIGKIYKTFAYVFENVDLRLQALKEASPGAAYTRYDKFVLFCDESAEIKPYMARSFDLASGNHIILTLVPGKLTKGLITTCPSIIFTKMTEKGRGLWFAVRPNYGSTISNLRGGNVELKNEIVLENVEYQATGADILTGGFKDEFNKAFSEFVKLSVSR